MSSATIFSTARQLVPLESPFDLAYPLSCQMKYKALYPYRSPCAESLPSSSYNSIKHCALWRYIRLIDVLVLPGKNSSVRTAVVGTIAASRKRNSGRRAMGWVRLTVSHHLERLARFQSHHLLVNDALTIRHTQNLDFILTCIDRRTDEWLKLKNAIRLGVYGNS